MGHVVVKYKVTINQPDEGAPDYDGIAGHIDGFEEVQAVEIKPLAFGMMFIEVQAVLGEGEGIVDALDIGRVVLAVVDLVDLPRNVRLECAVVVIEFRQGVFGHEGSPISGSGVRFQPRVEEPYLSTSTRVQLLRYS